MARLVEPRAAGRMYGEPGGREARPGHSRGDGAVAGCSEVRPPPQEGLPPNPHRRRLPAQPGSPVSFCRRVWALSAPGTCWGVGWGSGTSSFPTWSQASPHPTQP